jgi:hypothetical protein
VKRWFAPAPHGHCSVRALSAVEFDVTSRHLPLCRATRLASGPFASWTVPVAASMVSCGVQPTVMVVSVGKRSGSQTYSDSFTGRDQAPAQRSPR